MVGIGVDDDFHAVLLRLAKMNIVQVEAIRISVEFHGDFVLGGCAQHGMHIELITLAAKLDTTGGMSEDRCVRIPDCLQQTIGHLCRFLIEDGMHAGDDDIHLSQHVIG